MFSCFRCSLQTSLCIEFSFPTSISYSTTYQLNTFYLFVGKNKLWTQFSIKFGIISSIYQTIQLSSTSKLNRNQKQITSVWQVDWHMSSADMNCKWTLAGLHWKRKTRHPRILVANLTLNMISLNLLIPWKLIKRKSKRDWLFFH